MVTSYNSQDPGIFSFGSASQTQSFFPESSRHDSDISKSTGMGLDHSKSTRTNSASSKSIILDLELDKGPTRRDRRHLTPDHIQRLRFEVTRGRLDLRERRAGLRELRGKVADNGVKFYKEVQRYWSNRGNVVDFDLEKLDEGFQEAQDELGPMEEDYDEAEDDLGVLEYKLETREKKFYSQIGDSTSSIRSPSSERTQEQFPKNTVIDAAEDTSPRGRYLSRLGDARIIRERLQDLIVEQNEYFEQEQRRKSHSLPPYPPNVAFMANFHLVYAQLMKELHEVEADVRRLKDEAGMNSVDSQETAPSPLSSVESISEDQRAYFTTEEQAQQEVVQREDPRYAASEPLPHPERFNASKASTYPFTSRLAFSLRRISPDFLNGKCDEQRGEQLQNHEESYTAHTPAEDMEETSNLDPDRLQPPALSYITRDSVPSVPRYLGSQSRTSVPFRANTELIRRNGAADQKTPLTTLERISQWILDRLRCSKVEQATHKALLDIIFLEDGEWWVYVEKCWPQDQAGGTLLHTSSVSAYSALVDASLYSTPKEEARAGSADFSMHNSVYPTANYKTASSGLILFSYSKQERVFTTSRSV